MVATQPFDYQPDPANAATRWLLFASIQSDLSATNYDGNSGAYSAESANFFVGPFSSHKSARLSEILDGMSNSIMIGEIVGSATKDHRHRASWLFGGLMTFTSSPSFSAIGTPARSYLNAFASSHPTSANVAYCDGAVRCIPRTVEQRNLVHLAGISDHELASPD
jgi:prepilin-type processing-associated H-X9-DG protein